MTAATVQDTGVIGQVLDALAIRQADFARALGMAKSTACRLARHGEWPRTDEQRVRREVLRVLIDRGATAAHLALLRGAGLTVQVAGGQAGATTTPQATAQADLKEDPMLLQNEALKHETREHFKLPRNPFMDDINSREDVWASASTRYIRAAMLDAALHHGFIAIIGESGSGKSTLREELEQRIADENRPVHVIKPFTLDMEPSETNGKPMKSGHVAEAIVHALAPSVRLESSPQARFRQVQQLLTDSCRAGMRHLLLIEEAHRMPLATLRHMKGFMELKDGLRRLLGVCLVGQTELGDLLSEKRRDIREIVQRCERIHMGPLNADLEAYLKHKFARVGADVREVLADDAYDALRARLIYVPRGGRPTDAVSVCYPLAVNNAVSRAMNAAARAGWPKVDAQVVAAI